jgi:hypothetical protein
MKQQSLEQRITKLTLKFNKAKTCLATARRQAASTRLKARSTRQAQRLAKKEAQLARDAARAANTLLGDAERAFAKASARLKKARKKALKAQKSSTPVKSPRVAKSTTRKSRKPATPHRSLGPAIVASETAVASKRSGLHRSQAGSPNASRHNETIEFETVPPIASAS